MTLIHVYGTLVLTRLRKTVRPVLKARENLQLLLLRPLRGATSGAGRKSEARVSTNGKREQPAPEARMSSTLEFVGLEVWETFHQAPPQGEESGSKARTPWLQPGEAQL